MFNSDNFSFAFEPRNAQVTFVGKLQMKLIRLENQKIKSNLYCKGTIVIWTCHFIWNYYFRLSKHTERPNKHGNSVTNSISSFKIILWFSKVMHTEKALIRMNLVCYVYNFFVFVVLSKKRKITVWKQSKLVLLHCLSCGDNTHIFTAIYPFHKINSSRQNNTMAFEIRYYNANS